MKPLEAVLDRAEGRVVLRAPQPGLWREPPEEGALIRGGTRLGSLEILGLAHPLVAPEAAFGVVVDLPGDRRLARLPVDRGTPLLVLDPEAVTGGRATAGEEATETGGPVFRTPLGGRFYARPSPDEPPFVKPGDTLTAGQTVGLIEVMKTFNRVRYDGDPMKVAQVVPEDGADVEAGDVLLALEPT